MSLIIIKLYFIIDKSLKLWLTLNILSLTSLLYLMEGKEHKIVVVGSASRDIFFKLGNITSEY